MLGHPRGLQTLFFTEMWERFSYYGMRALLILFMTATIESEGMGLTTETAGAIYGLYVALVYLMALPGGWIADRLLGQRQAVFVGGCIIAAGHFSMAIPATATFFSGLLLITIGTGLLKPNVSAIVADLYPEGGARRDAGFSIFYMGINLGAFIGPLICGALAQGFKMGSWIEFSGNWHYGFGAAGFGMVAGVIQYRLGYPGLKDAGLRVVHAQHPTAVRDARRKLGRGLLLGLGLALLAVGLQAMGVIQLTAEKVANGTGVFIVGLAAVYFAWLLAAGGLDTLEKKRLGVIICLFIGSAIFWAGFEQAGSSLNLFADQLTNLNILGWAMPSSWLQSVNPLFIILLAPVFGWLWVWLAHREPSIPVKFALGLLLLAAGFLVVAWGASFAGADHKVSPMWLVMTYFFHTAGELCLSPVGLSSVTKLSPRRLVGQMMGLWFTATALGNLMAGLMGGLFEKLALPTLFGSVALLAGGTGVLFLLFTPWIRRMIGPLR